MTNSAEKPLSGLGVLHIIVGLLLLPLSGFFGILLIPVLGIGPVWIIVLGALLFRPNDRTPTLLRRTHLVGVGVAVLLCAYGLYALQAADRSAAEGGGLLGAFGLIPIVFGVLLGVTSILSLWLTRGAARS